MKELPQIPGARGTTNGQEQTECMQETNDDEDQSSHDDNDSTSSIGQAAH